MTPAPLQLAHAPSELALNSAGFTPLALANAVRIGSSSPVYVAGLLRREPRIGPWSTETTPAPAGIDPCTSELLPEPATPVTTTSTPSGISTSTSRRLCAVAPRISSAPVGVRTVSLSAARSSRWRPVRVPLDRSPSAVPSKQTVPPAAPAPGPRSTTWSAIAIVSGLCSTTSTVFALVPQPQQQVVHPLDVMGGQARGGLVDAAGPFGQGADLHRARITGGGGHSAAVQRGGQRNVCHRDTRLAHAAASVGRHAADVGGRSRHDSRCNQGGRRGYSSDGRATTTMKKATTTMKTRVSGFSGVERVGVMDGGGAWGEAV